MSAATLPPLTRRYTRAEVQEMLDAGFFDGQRFELIDGELIYKMGQRAPHAFAVRTLSEVLPEALGKWHMQTQLPIEVSVADRIRSEPEPDVAVFVSPAEYQERHPCGDELALVIEVSETTLMRDLTAKRDLYARAGIPEYWVLDIAGRRLVVHRHPSQGAYEHIFVLGENEIAQPERFPQVSVLIARLLPR